MGAYDENGRVLFIHIPKTGGWSVKKYCQEHLANWLMPNDPKSKLPIGHVRLQDIERFTGRKPESFELILAVLRNPFEQQISQACFWAKRFLQGGKHVHDVNTARYLRLDRVQARLERCAYSEEAFSFQPGDLTLTGFVSDPACDFHIFYCQHWGYYPSQPPAEQEATRRTDVPAEGPNEYEEFGGLYRFWLTVYDPLSRQEVIPTNVRVVHLERLDEEVRPLLQPYAEHDLPPLPHLNTSPHAPDWRDWLAAERNPDLCALAIQRKFAWAFEHHYQPLVSEPRRPLPSPT